MFPVKVGRKETPVGGLEGGREAAAISCFAHAVAEGLTHLPVV